MKKVLFAIMSLMLAVSVIACNGSSDDEEDDGDQGGSGDSGALVLLDESKAYELDWAYKTFEAALIADVEDGSMIAFKVEKTANDYQVLQICLADDSQIVAGTVIGADINGDGNGFVPTFANDGFIYIPTAAEWAKLKTDGIRIQGHGMKVSAIAIAGADE